MNLFQSSNTSVIHGCSLEFSAPLASVMPLSWFSLLFFDLLLTGLFQELLWCVFLKVLTLDHLSSLCLFLVGDLFYRFLI